MTDKQTIDKLFHSFEGKRILVIGDVMIDSYIWGGVDRISPEAPVPVVSVRKRENRLGGAANVALNVRNLGGIAVLCSIIGDDDKARLFAELMGRENLPAEGIIRSKQRLTTVKFRIFGNSTQMLRVDEESSHPLGAEEQSLLLGRITAMVEAGEIDAIVFEDYDKGVITAELIAAVVALSKAADVPVAVDPKRKNFLSYGGVHLFKPNLKELREGLKLDADLSELSELEAAVKTLHEGYDIGLVLVTLSDKGVFLSGRNRRGGYHQRLIPAHVRSIADVSGAGDTVIGTAAMCLAAGASDELMAALCNLAGGLVCEQVGVVPVDKHKLMDEAIRYFT